MGGDERLKRPAGGGGLHLKGRNNVEDPQRRCGLRPAAAGLEGSAAHPAPRESHPTPSSRRCAMANGARNSGRCVRRRYRRAETAPAGPVHEHPARERSSRGRPISSSHAHDFPVGATSKTQRKGLQFARLSAILEIWAQIRPGGLVTPRTLGLWPGDGTMSRAPA